MKYFTKEQKDFAIKHSIVCIEKALKSSEQDLKYFALVGDEKSLQIAMDSHRLLEGALLYTYTPEYRKKYKK